LANIAFELGIGVRNERSEVGNCALVNDGLSELFGVFGDFGESGRCDTLESEFGLLDAEDEETDGASIDDGLSKFVVVLSDAGESESSGFLN
jgi:hypothetical protein